MKNVGKGGREKVPTREISDMGKILKSVSALKLQRKLKNPQDIGETTEKWKSKTLIKNHICRDRSKNILRYTHVNNCMINLN